MAEPEFRLPAFDEDRHEPLKPKRRAIVLGFAKRANGPNSGSRAQAAVTISGLGAALYVGKLGYNVRRNNMHDARLKHILVQTPTVYQVTEGLKEKAPLALVVEGRVDLEQAIADWGADKADEIRDKAGEWPQLRVYAAGDMMYFIYFDEGNVMRDYVYVSS